MKQKITTTQRTVSVVNVRGRQPVNPHAGTSGQGSGTGSRAAAGVPTVSVINRFTRKAVQ
jgi:hypothetical protein